MQRIIHTLTEFEEEAARFSHSLAPTVKWATLITLSGELGAGKTAFTKAVARTLGVTETVNSPTFVLEKIYKLGSANSEFERLIHIDAYRLEKGSDLASLGFDEIMQEPENLILLEWPEKVADALVKFTAKTISIEVLPDNARKLVYG